MGSHAATIGNPNRFYCGVDQYEQFPNSVAITVSFRVKAVDREICREEGINKKSNGC